jgi:hypothetical protein
MNKTTIFSIVAWIYLCSFLCPSQSSEKINIFHEIRFFPLFFKKIIFCFRCKTNGNRLQILKRLVSKKIVIYFKYILHEISKIEQISPLNFFFIIFCPWNITLQQKRVKQFVGLITHFSFGQINGCGTIIFFWWEG